MNIRTAAPPIPAPKATFKVRPLSVLLLATTVVAVEDGVGIVVGSVVDTGTSEDVGELVTMVELVSIASEGGAVFVRSRKLKDCQYDIS